MAGYLQLVADKIDIDLVTVTSERGVSGPGWVPLAVRALSRAVRSRSQEAGTRWP